MKTREDVVIARDGTKEEVPVTVVVCPNCDNDTFAMYFIRGHEDQPHLQCIRCSVTFCGHAGDCSEASH